MPALAALSIAAQSSTVEAAEPRSARGAAGRADAASAVGRSGSPTDPSAPVMATTTLYRSTMPDGRVVLGDRPESGARAVEVSGSLPVADRSSVSRAQQERDYWRQRSEAFAQRQLLRQLNDERERAGLAARREHAVQPMPAVYGAPILYRPRTLLNYPGLEAFPQYTTSPGAAGRNLAISNSGPAFGAGSGGAMGGFTGAAGGAGSSFIGSGFARSTR